jgi:hypothetical protein
VVGPEREPEVARVEVDCLLDVVDQVSDVDDLISLVAWWSWMRWSRKRMRVSSSAAVRAKAG